MASFPIKMFENQRGQADAGHALLQYGMSGCDAY